MNSIGTSFGEKSLRHAWARGSLGRTTLKFQMGMSYDIYLLTSLQINEFDVSSFAVKYLLKEIYEHKIHIEKLEKEKKQYQKDFKDTFNSYVLHWLLRKRLNG